MKGESEKVREVVLTEFHHNYGQELGRFNIKCIHHGKWKFVYYGNRPYGELYNLEDDPRELHNLYGETAYRKKVKEFEAILLDELIRTEGEWPPVYPATA